MIAISVQNHIANAGSETEPAGWSGSFCHITRMLKIPNAIQNEPHMPCIAVAIVSRTR